MNKRAIKAYTSILLAMLLIVIDIPMIKSDFVDNYLNENYIAIKEKIVRNPILNAMELNYSVTKKNGKYEKDGFFYTIKILGDLNESSLVLLTNSTLDKGSITIQFSSDNSTWVDHNNQTGHDSLIEGFSSIDLRDLNFTSIYLRYEFESKGKKTPRLYQTMIIWTEAPIKPDDGVVIIPDDYSVIFLAIGIIMTLSVYFLTHRTR